ncbi:MAG: class II glutamine amidotransferase [Candidatus Limnocylindrales bacterium]
MCELFVARGERPFSVADLWPLAERLERYGIAGFGWGAAWRRPNGSLATYRHTGAFRDDAAGREAVGAEETMSVLVHLRRPSRLSTLAMPDTQPFLDPAGRFAFAHNGDLRHHRLFRSRYRAEGRIHGRADSEVGARWLEDAWDQGAAPLLLAALHDAMGGQANLALLDAAGTLVVYAGNQENPVFRFRLPRPAPADGPKDAAEPAGAAGRAAAAERGGGADGPGAVLDIVATGIYSLDRSFFRYVAPGATDRAVVAYRTSVALLSGVPQPTGAATPGR